MKVLVSVLLGIAFLGLVVLLLFDQDDLLFSASSNKKLMAVVYTPHVAPGDPVVLKLILRTGTKSRISAVRAFVGDAPLSVTALDGTLAHDTTKSSSEQIVRIRVPKKARAPGRLRVDFEVDFEPPRKNPMPGDASLTVPVKVTSRGALWKPRLWRVLQALLAFVLMLPLSQFLAGSVVRVLDAQIKEDAEWASVNAIFGLGMLGMIGYWAFAMPVVAATGVADNWLFAVLIAAWLAAALAAGWRGGQRALLATPTDENESVILGVDDPSRSCTARDVARQLSVDAPELRVDEHAQRLTIRQGSDELWLLFANDAALKLEALRIVGRPKTSMLLLAVAHALAKCLGGFQLEYAGGDLHVDPQLATEELQKRSADAMLEGLERMGERLRAMGAFIGIELPDSEEDTESAKERDPKPRE